MRSFKITVFLIGILAATGCASEKMNQTVNLQTPGNSNANSNKTANEDVRAENINKSLNSDDSEQTVKLGGNWNSEQLTKSGNKHTEFSIAIQQIGDKINGTYSVTDFVDGEPQIEDGNQTPFTGTVKGNTAEIKFDPEATVPGYEEKVEYKEPADGKKAATATLLISGKILMWKTTSGEISGGLPKEIKLIRDEMNQVSEE